ncbi:MAG: M67 family metallopeptidase [Synergistaceae bacterium]|jgi:proteasome lid subunit RPN8/RPN11|nr:M67 family metallopeptidase [Synergistaceae bacterium]
MISLSSDVISAITSEGERAYPNECCGALLGTDCGERGRGAAYIFPVKNGRELEEQYHRFEILPEDYMASEREADRLGLDVIGFYHSHPDHAACPSDYDREHAVPWYSYVIVAVVCGRADDITSWTLAPDRSMFEAEQIVRQDVDRT